MISFLFLLACSFPERGSRSDVNAPPVHPNVPVLQVEPGTEPVSLTAAGVKLAPPVTPDRIPEGAWYCDMGKVHYARAEKGDGMCPLCNMQLTRKGGAPR